MIRNNVQKVLLIFVSLFVLRSNCAADPDRTISVLNKYEYPITLKVKRQQPDKDVAEEKIEISKDQEAFIGTFRDVVSLGFAASSDVKDKKDPLFTAIDFKKDEGEVENKDKNLLVTIGVWLFRWHVSLDWVDPTEAAAQPPMRPSVEEELEEFQELDGKDGQIAAGWHDITYNRRDLHKDGDVFIKKAMVYLQDPIEGFDAFLNAQRAVLFVIHGTFAARDPQFYSLDDKTFQALKKYAESLGKNVELVSIGWSGDNERTARENTYKYIKLLFDQLYNNRALFTEINFLGYSHGGNIINLLTQDDEFNGKIHNIISVYTPIREDYKTNLDAITGKLYHFYSTGDVVQYMGSFQSADFSYQSIYPWFKKFTSLPTMSSAGFKGGRKVAQEIDNIREQKALNYRVKINGGSPTHLYIEPIIKYLDAIITETAKLYKYNFDFDLNIDTRNNEIYLAIRREYDPNLIKQIHDKALEEALKKEQSTSEKVEEQFEEKYGVDIHEKSPVGEIIYSPGVSDARCVCPPYRYRSAFCLRTT